MRRAALIAATAMAFLIGAESAHACSCASPEDFYDDMDVALNARLIEKEREGRRHVFTYRINRIFKTKKRYELKEGDKITEEVLLYGPCGSRQREGKRYGLLLYNEGKGEGLEVSACTVTTARSLRKIAAENGDGRSGGTISCGGSA